MNKNFPNFISEPKGEYFQAKTYNHLNINQTKINLTSNNQRLWSVYVFDDLDPRLSPLCQVGDDVICPCNICGGCQIRLPRSIHSSIDCPIQSRLQSVLSQRHTWRVYTPIAAIGENRQVCPVQRLRFSPIAAIGV